MTNWSRKARRLIGSPCRKCGLPLQPSETVGCLRCPTPTCPQITWSAALKRLEAERERQQQKAREEEAAWRMSLPHAKLLGERGHKRVWTIEGNRGYWHYQSIFSHGDTCARWSQRLERVRQRHPGAVLAHTTWTVAVFVLVSVELPRAPRRGKRQPSEVMT